MFCARMRARARQRASEAPVVSVGGWLQNMREQKERREKYTAPSNTFAKFSGELHHRRSRGPRPTPHRPVSHRTTSW